MRFAPATWVATLSVMLAACGGSDGGGDRTPTPVPERALFVRVSGNDGNSGRTPMEALRTVARAAQLAAPGTTVIVGPGTYVGRVDIDGIQGTQNRPVRFVADIAGTATGDRAGAVTLDAGGDIFSVRVSRTPYLTLDGFTLTGALPGSDATAAGLQVRSQSHHADIRNCIVTTGGLSDGIRLQNSSDALLFNNLVFDTGRGIRIADGAQRARLINNTVATSRNIAVLIGGANEQGEAASGATLLNNILQPGDGRVTIRVEIGPPSALDGYMGNFNLSFVNGLSDQLRAYQPEGIRGADDVNERARFLNVERGDFRLDQTRSPAVDAGTDTIDEELLAELFARTTDRDNRRDRPPVDLGYHYPLR